MARKSRYMGYKNAARTMRNAPEVPKRETAHESIRQWLRYWFGEQRKSDGKRYGEFWETGFRREYSVTGVNCESR